MNKASNKKANLHSVLLGIIGLLHCKTAAYEMLYNENRTLNVDNVHMATHAIYNRRIIITDETRVGGVEVGGGRAGGEHRER